MQIIFNKEENNISYSRCVNLSQGKSGLTQHGNPYSISNKTACEKKGSWNISLLQHHIGDNSVS